MVTPRIVTPSGHGELLTEPAYGSWAGLARENARAARAWDFEVCGVPASQLRLEARREAIGRARALSDRLGVPVAAVDDDPDTIVMTGHQPEFFHPGVWVKDFLLQRLSEDADAAAIDLVVDSDGFDTLAVHSPCLRPEVRVCTAYLAVGTADGSYAGSPVPDGEAIATFGSAVAEHLATLPAPSIARHFATFRDRLAASADDATDLAELVTFARRRYEAAAGTDYLELPVTSLAGSRAFATFLSHLAIDATGFAGAYNASLAEYRERTGTRSAAQPFPDLRREGDRVELPVWHLGDGRRAVWARVGPAPALMVGEQVVCEFPDGVDPVAAVLGSSLVPAPKALALTLFTRLFVADFFIHGTGGGRYDRVTDAVIRSYFGVEPPAFGIASMTMYLPLGARMVRADEVEALAMALNRLKHNPDQMLDEVEFDSGAEREQAEEAAAEKRRLVAAITEERADKKTLGVRIREVNESLAALLEPYEQRLREELDELRRLQEAGDILTDRTYPFCFWDPLEIADKAR